MSAKRDLIAEIAEIRGRTSSSDWDNGITKLLFLCTQMQKLEEESEQQAYFVVASIAAIETYFRWEIRRLIDSADAQYVNNFRVDKTPIKIGHDILVAMHGKHVTIGELVAHSVRLNNLEAIGRTMSQVLGADFLGVIKDARDPESRREKGAKAPTIISSISDTLAYVKRTFELRHIICHEAHLSTPVRLEEARKLCASCYDFVLASRYGIAYHENPDAPLTLLEAYRKAEERVAALEIQVRDVEGLIISKLPALMQGTFEAMQEAWKSYIKREAEFNGSAHMNGTRGVLHEQLEMESFYSKRINELKKYAQKIGTQGSEP